MANTFPTVSANELAEIRLTIRAEYGARIERPGLVNALIGTKSRKADCNRLPVVESGKVSNKAWRELHAAEAFVYGDESGRSRQSGGSQVETVRAYIVKRIIPAFEDVIGESFPYGALMLTGGSGGTVEIWRVV